MFPYISFNYSQYILLLTVAIIFYNNSLNIIGKKKRVYPYIIQLIVTIAVPLLTYQAQKMLSIYSYPVMPYVIFSLIIYVLLIIVLKSFASIRNGMFNIRDIIILALTFIIVCAVFTVTMKMQLTSGSLLILLLLCILIFLIYELALSLYMANSNKKYADKLQEQLTSGEDYIKNVSMLDRQIRSIKHDMNNQLQVLSGLINNGQFNEASDFLKQYGIGLEKTIDYINTNNPVINTLINSKIAYAKSENIITAIAITKDIKPMTGNDLCSIIGNVIDNAIEAELHEEESLRQLHIQAYWDDEEMVFHVSNYINETVLDRNSGLATTKEDKNSHGLGTNIVKSLAKRNYGTCDYYETENEFHCEIRW